MMELDPACYTVAWIAPLEIETQAALHMLDNRHYGRFPVTRGDDYVFHAGDICGHNVIVATLPAGQEYGTGSAAALASQVKKFFPNLWFGLLVGIGAGLPKLSKPTPRDIRLGDVLVALPEGDSAGLVAYELGKETHNGFKLLQFGHVLATTEAVVRSAIGSIKLNAPNEATIFLPHYDRMKGKEHIGGTFADLGQENDILCVTNGDGIERKANRERRPDTRRTRVWYGPIGSGEKLVKDAKKRDELRDTYNVIGLEMEAAGTMNRIPVGVIRGVSDYGDEHKNKIWQPYAAAMAAAYAKAVLQEIPPKRNHKADAQQTETQTAELPSFNNSSAISYIPFPQNKAFTGRDSIMSQLKNMLFKDGKEKVALVGLGGIGKTQVALQLAYWAMQQQPRQHVIWVPALSMAGFEKTCLDVIQELGIRYPDNEDPKEVMQQFLNSQTKSWLLIVDNADDMGALYGASKQEKGIYHYLPRSDYGRMLFTTRSQEVAVNVARKDVVELRKMTVKEAKTLLERSLIYADQLQEEAVLKKFLSRVVCLPLAIAQAAAYINISKGSITIADYIDIFDTTSQDAIELLSSVISDEAHYDDSQGAAATTWIVSFRQIEKTNPLAAELLSFLSWIEPKDIPRSILPNLQSRQKATRAIGTLCGYRFLERRGKEDMFDMHSLVHLSMKEWGKEQEVTQEATFKHLSAIFRTDDWGERNIWRTYLPHVLQALEVGRGCEDEEYCDVGYWAGRCLRVDGRIKEAVRLLENVVAVRKKTLAKDHPDRLASQHALAISYEANGQVKEAVILLEHVVAVRKKTLAEDHPDRLASQHALAISYEANGQVKEAVTLLEHVLAVEKKTLAEDHPSRLASQHELAKAYRANGQVKEAVMLLEHVMAVRKKTLAEDHPSRLASQHELAIAYRANGQVKEAVILLEHVVAVEKKTLAEDHPSRLASQHELAIAYRANGQVKEAVMLLEHVVAVRKKTLAEDHPDRLASQHALAIAYQANGQVKDAVILLEHVVALRKKTLAEDHPSRLASQHELAIAYRANGQVKEAVMLLEHVVAVRKKTLAEDHPSRLISEHALAMMHDNL